MPLHKGVLLFIVASIAPAAASPDITDLAWPAAAVPINATEAVIEAFWDPAIAAEKRWTFTSLANGNHAVPEPSITRLWDCVETDWETSPTSEGARIERSFELPILDYENLILRLNLGPDCFAMLSAKIDGHWRVLGPPTPGDLSAIEVDQEISGTTLEGIRIDLSSNTPGTQTARLRWLMLQKPGIPWTAPSINFEKYITQPATAAKPGLGLLFGTDDLDRMRDRYLSSVFEEVRTADSKLAASQMAVAPLTNLRPFILYGRESIRIRERHYRRDVDGLLLAMHGLLNRDEASLTRAAEHAIVLAHMDHWADGLMGRFPGSNWTHSGFAPNVGTIQSSLILDWCWDVLTPAGRELIRDAIRTKGLPYLEEQRSAMTNQGVRFHKGLILGKIACDTTRSPQHKNEINADLARMNAQLKPLIRDDGTFTEELGYGLGTLASTLVTYQAAANYLGLEIADVVNSRAIDGLNFALLQKQSLSAPLAAFAAGPLEEKRMTALCAPSSILEASGFAHTEMAVFGLDWLWALELSAAGKSPLLSPFSVHPEGGWVFAGSDAPDAPRISLESGFWDEGGHTYKRKNALTLSSHGEPLLLTRHHVAYADQRFPATAATTAYNTFAPGGRSQDPENSNPNSETERPRGAELLTTIDLGHTVVLESDTTTAWRENVEHSLRRVIFLRPGVMLIEDTARLTTPETGVQTWNSLFPWQQTTSHQATITTENSVLELQVISPSAEPVRIHENSVHRTAAPITIVPVHAATVTLPANPEHRLFTLIKSHATDADPPSVEILRNDLTEPTGLRVQQGDTTWSIYLSSQGLDQVRDLETDGTWGFTTSEAGRTVEVGVFGATQLSWKDQHVSGSGFLALKNASSH